MERLTELMRSIWCQLPNPTQLDAVILNQTIVATQPSPHPQPFSLGEKGARFKVSLPSGEGFRVRVNCCKQILIWYNFAFEVDHTTPLSKGASDELNNLALSCRICNLRKSDHTDAIDPLTKTNVPSSTLDSKTGQSILRNPPRLHTKYLGRPASVVPQCNALTSTHPYNSAHASFGLL